MIEPDYLRSTRTFYEAVALDYADRCVDALAARPLDRALLAGFAETVRGAGTVADLGCGPGRVTAHLDELGVPAFGVDLSPRMVELARQEHPGLRFEVGSMTALDLPDGALGGIVAWYSIIHTPQEVLPEVFDEFHRVLAPGGHVLVAFQAGDEPLHLTRPLGHAVSLDFRRLLPDEVAGLLEKSGLAVHARTLREPEDDGAETTQQAFLLARKPADA